jgi:hypothetical protein
MNIQLENLGVGLLLSTLCACAPVDVKEFTLQPIADIKGSACTAQIAGMVADISVLVDGVYLCNWVTIRVNFLAQ